ncbi:MAG: sodium:proton antiporter [Nitrospirales bacterium]|nr:sodium:proton antiporter [Nitrospirales bacterium]
MIHLSIIALIVAILGSIGIPTVVFATDTTQLPLDMTTSSVGYLALGIFVLAYALVMAEEFTHLRKSKPVILAAGIIWVIISIAYPGHDHSVVEQALRHNVLEYAELMLFLLVAMTYINAMEERLVFESLRAWLIHKGFTYRQLFWITGILAFFISPIADNLTTALLMCAVVLAVGADNPRFVSLSCINIVVAANAGGAFSPFGDITTLMVWQKGIVDFFTFFLLFIPSVVNFVIPAALMHFAVPQVSPSPSDEVVSMKRGASIIMALFFLTICTAVSFHNFLHLPPMTGMMTGLAYLKFFGYYLQKTHNKYAEPGTWSPEKAQEAIGDVVPFDIFREVSRAEWDTLLFFYGVIICVGGLGFLGYLTLTSELMYVQWGPTYANVMVGILSAIVDNIPVMFAVLTMSPNMSEGQWLLVTLTAGVGGSLLSIGSAAGVALMGQAKGKYTFFSHLRWMPAIALGYAASILTHLWINSSRF